MTNNSTIICTPATVQDPIVGFSITSTPNLYFPYNTNILVQFVITAGTILNGSISASIDSSTPTVSWIASTRSGSVTITPSNMIGVGTKVLTITVSNQVTAPISLTYPFTVQYNFTQFTYLPANGYFNTSLPTSLKLFWVNASVETCIIDFQMTGSPYTETYNLVIANSNTSITTTNQVTYSSPGLYKIFISCTNHIATFNYTIQVTAQNPICCCELDVDYVETLTSNTGSTAHAALSLIWNDITKPFPTAAHYDFDFNNGMGSAYPGNIYNSTNETMTYPYTVSKCYTINVTVYNLVSIARFTQIICIVVQFGQVSFNMTKLQPLTGHEPNYYYLKTNEVANFTVTLTQGTFFNIIIDYKDGTTPFNHYESNNGLQFTNQHSFSKAGTYLVNLTVQHKGENDIQKFLPVPSTPQYVVVEEAVDCFSFDIIEGLNPVISYPQKSIGVTIHTNVSMNTSCGSVIQQTLKYSIFWGDGATDSGTVPSGSSFFFVNHTYTVSGIYAINYTIWNDVSILSETVNLHVFEEVTSVKVNATWDNLNTSQHLLLGYYVNSTIGYFPYGNPVTFYASLIWGNLQSYVWTINGQVQPENGTQLIRSNLAVGSYVVNVKISNTPTAGTWTFTAVIERPTVNANLTDNSPFPLFEYHRFSISMDAVGTESCYFFNMDDVVVQPSKADCQYVFFGNAKMCEEFFTTNFSIKASKHQCPSYTPLEYSDLTGPVVDLGNGNDTTEPIYGTANGKAFINFTHLFAHKGAHNVTFTVINHVSNKTIYFRSVVSAGWCNFPVVNVFDLNTCQNQDTCKCYNNPPDYICKTSLDMEKGNRIVYTKDKVLIDSEVSINCSSSPNVWFRWSLRRFNSTSGTDTYDVTNLLNSLPHETFFSRTLVIPPHILPEGRYVFNLMVH